MKTVIIKYNAGNVQSVMYALDRIGASYLLTDDEAEIRSADKVIFPGVGEASTAMAYLRQRGLDRVIPSLKQPVLGTCVGMQLLCRYSEEGDTTCMGVFDVDVRRFPNRREDGPRGYAPRDEEPIFKVPHIGWNNLTSLRGQLTEGLAENSYVYFVHSYCADICQETTAVCDYVRPFSAMLQKNNFYAAQFHAEISGNVGQRILENFLKI